MTQGGQAGRDLVVQLLLCSCSDFSNLSLPILMQKNLPCEVQAIAYSLTITLVRSTGGKLIVIYD
jgi:hypothetical protein